MKLSATDHIEQVRAQWAAELPDVDSFASGLVGRVARLARYFDQGLDELFAEHGVRRGGWDVLAALRRTGAPYRLSPTALYLGLLRTSGAITNRLNRLEQAGLITRIEDPADGRGVLVELTAEGRRRVDALVPAHGATSRDMLAALTPAEQHTLNELLAKLLAALESRHGESPRGGRGRCPRV